MIFTGRKCTIAPMSARLQSGDPLLLRLLAVFTCILLVAAMLLLESCSPKPQSSGETIFSPSMADALSTRSHIPSPEVQACSSCHPAQFNAWMKSQHATANRILEDSVDFPRFEARQPIGHGALSTLPALETNRPALVESRGDQDPVVYEPVAVIGVDPLEQYLVPAAGGRLQASNISYDVRSNEWFNSQERMYEPHEWQFWQNRGMTWNSQCAFCHMTGFKKNYDPASDTYDSDWHAMGIQCVQCHGDVTAHMEDVTIPPGGSGLHSNQIQAACASCHARREELTGRFNLGDEFSDHYRLHLPDAVGAYHPDGQAIEENFVYGSFLMSRMGHKGVTCLDCHDPHSAGLVLPVANNALCMSCHAPPTRREAKPIIPVDHSHHPIDSDGNRCIECHMPEKTFMARDARRDHGFTSPDPLLTKELGIPNACNRCHQDQTTEWAIEWTTRWYGEDMNQPARKRARVVARAHDRDPDVAPELLALARSEEIHAWKATLTGLLSAHVEREDVCRYLVDQLKHPDPLVRSAAIRGLAPLPQYAENLKALRADPARLVRLDAGWATWSMPPRDPAGREQIFEYFKTICDQPAGALRRAQLAIAENRLREAEAWARKAVAWDDFHFHNMMLGRVLSLNGMNREAKDAFRRAIEQDPGNAEYPFLLALLHGEMKEPREALHALQKAVNLDPEFSRAWYNLGLAYAELDRLGESITALNRAEGLMPGSPEPAFARATIYLRLGQRQNALESAQKALNISPGFEPARRLVEELTE